MKKIYLFIALFAAASTACNKNEMDPIQNGEEPKVEVKMITETVTGGKGSTKATIANADASFSWTTGDNIAVHVSNGDSHKYVFTSDEGASGASTAAASASFTVVYPEGYSRDAFALFPSTIVSENATNYGQSGTALDVTLPSSYTLAQVSGETSPCPMIATNNAGSGWNFYQLCGLLRLTVNCIPPTAKRLEIDFDGKKVCGDFSIASTVTPNSSEITTSADDSHDIITITKDGTDVTLNDNAWLNGLVLNIPLPTGTYSNITITAYDALMGGEAILATDPYTFSYTASHTRAKRLTTTMGFDLSTSSFNDNTFPYAYIFQSNPGTATSNTITIANGQKVLLDGVNMLVSGNAINCEGAAEIVLCGTNKVYSQKSSSDDIDKAIIKAGPKNTTLTLSGSGSLDVRTDYNGSWMGAFIGSDKNGDCGNITITGGTITAIAYKPYSNYKNSASYGAIIGAGSSNSGVSSCGDILITGGTVTADTHRGTGAGIGSGTSENESGYSTCGIITISGGNVTACSDFGGAAIGTGSVNIHVQNPSYDGYSKCKGIIITGSASVNATSSSNGTAAPDHAGAAIGTGNAGEVGYITISGGVVTASMTGFCGPGIGAGKYRSTCGDITISGGTITASGGYKAAAIGTAQGLNKWDVL